LPFPSIELIILLNLLNEGWNKNYEIASSFTVNDDKPNDQTTNGIKQKIIQKLKHMGTEDQSLMFVTGPATAGKSTVIKVTHHFPFELRRTMDIILGEQTYLFTGITGCATVLFGGVILRSAALKSRVKIFF
jgi:hypothetical protein